MPPLINGKIEENTGLYNALARVKDLDITCGVLRVAAHDSIGLVGISSCKEIVGAVIKDPASKLLSSEAIDKILSLTSGTFEFYEIPQKELLRLDQRLSLDISDILNRASERGELVEAGENNGHGAAEAFAKAPTEGVVEDLDESHAQDEAFTKQTQEVIEQAGEAYESSENAVEETTSGIASQPLEETPAYLEETADIPARGPEESLHPVDSTSSGMELHAIPKAGSGASKFELDSIPTPKSINSDLSRTELDSIPTPAPVVNKSVPQAIATSSPAASKSELDSTRTPGLVASKSELDSIGASKDSSVGVAQGTGSLLAKFKEKKPGESTQSSPLVPAPEPISEPAKTESGDDEVNRNAAATVERIKKFRRPDAELEAEAEKAQRNKFASSRKSRPEEESANDADAEAKRIRPAGKQQTNTLKEKSKPRPIPAAVKIAVGVTAVIAALAFVARIPTANFFVNNAQAQFDKHDFSGAESTLSMATTIDPWNGKAHLLKGELAKAQKNNSKAFEELEQALQAQPDDPDTLRAYVLAARKVGRFDLVKSGTQNLMAHDPTAATDGYWLGILAQSHYSTGEFKEAAAGYSKALQAGLRTPWIYSGRGWAELYANDPKAAIKDFNTAIALPKDKSQADARIGKGQALTQLNDFKGAMACFDSALQMDNKLTYGYLRRAGLYLQMNQQDKAMADYDEALKIDPKLAEANVGRSNVFAKRGKLDLALKELRNVKGVDYERAALQMQSNEFAAAAESLKKGLEAHPIKDPNKYMDLAFCYGRLKKNKDAEAACAEAVKLAPTNSEFVGLHGLYLNNVGQTVSGRAELEQALRLNPKNAEAHLWRGMMSASSGDMISARQDFAEAARLKPSLSASIDALRKSDRKYLAASAAENAPKQRRVLRLIDGDFKTLLETGYSKLKNHQLEGAVQYLASAVNKDPNSLEARRYLAYAFSTQGNLNDAVDQYRSIVSMSGTNTTDQRNYAELLAKVDQPEAASSIYLSLLVSNVHDSDARIKLANCYSAMGKLQEAVDACENGKKVDPTSTAAYDSMITKLRHHQTAQPKSVAPSTQAPIAIPSG